MTFARCRRGLLSALGGAVLLAAVPAGAELLRCMGPDGKMIYTDKKEVCPEAEPFEPKGELQVGSTTGEREQREEAASSSRSRLAERRRRANERMAALEAQQGEEQRWRKKKADLEQEIEKTVARREYLKKFVTNCNRGGIVWARDEAGIKRKVKCSDIKRQFAEIQEKEQHANARLAELPEECRKAGCHPGWLR
ncbi:MAG: hypothetical protein ACQGVC_23775 [Myxococcota bacterium]